MRNIKKSAKPEFAKKTRFQNIPLKDLLNINETQRDKISFILTRQGASFWKNGLFLEAHFSGKSIKSQIKEE